MVGDGHLAWNYGELGVVVHGRVEGLGQADWGLVGVRALVVRVLRVAGVDWVHVRLWGDGVGWGFGGGDFGG